MEELKHCPPDGGVAHPAGLGRFALFRGTRGEHASLEAATHTELLDTSLACPQVKAVQIHHLGPRRDKVLYKLLLAVLAGVHLGDGSELGLGAKDQVDAGAGPLFLAGLAVHTLKELLSVRRLPRRAHVEEVDEKVVGEFARTVGEDAVG